jgi:pSer/pThr/pTyr-binding forkhead associated (FHA) protein
VVDVGSLYGTYVNRDLVESATLANGDKIYIGIFCLIVLKSRNA